MATAMSSKLTTKNWVDKPDFAVDTKVTELTDAQKKKLGADDIGAVLNKASDPNWVDSGRKVNGHGDSNLDKDAFFKLMLTQMKNQDPMNPLKNHEMAAQLAQFSTLEQMNNMNATLTKIENKNSDPQNFQALNLIGKVVNGDSSKITRSASDKVHDFNFTSSQDLSEATIKVFNQKGDAVKEFKLNNLKAGAQKISWNGQNSEGEIQKPGEYQFKIEAKNKLSQPVNIKSEFEGKITGMSFSAEGPILQIGNQTIKMKDVKQISDPGIKNNDQNITDVTSLDLKNNSQVKQNNIKQEANTSANKSTGVSGASGGGDIMTDVPMSREVMNQLQKAEEALKTKSSDVSIKK